MVDIQELKEFAKKLRIDILKMLHASQSGHPGGSLGAVEIVTTIYKTQMKINEDPLWEERDRFVLSKGHAAPVLYSTLAQLGYFPKEELMSLRKLNTRLQGHPVIQTKEHKAPGVDFTTGPLGQGFSGACGMALGFKLDNKPNRVYSVLGDGECQEGQIWEAAMFAAHNKLDNLIAVIDNNGLQIDGKNDEVMSLGSLKDKWEAFGFSVQEVDGHNFEELIAAFEKAKETKGKPSAIIAHTHKGQGVSFMADDPNWHGVAPNDEELAKALAEVEGQ